MRKTILILILGFLSFVNAQAQYDNYIRISGGMGSTINSQRDKKLGMGGDVSWLTTDYLISLNYNNFFTLGIKAHNNPYGEGKFISSILNKKNDAFNYIMPFAGYRITQHGVENGFFIEPRIGAVFGSGYSAFAFAPIAGYAFSNFDISIYGDMGFGSEENAILKTNFYTIGVSFAYTLKL